MPSPRVQRPQIAQQPPIKALTPDGHLRLIERILHHIIRIQLVNLPNDTVYVGLQWLREQEELGPRERGEALHTEVFGFEDFDAGWWVGSVDGGGGVAGGGVGGCGMGEGVEAGCYCVDSV